MFSSNVRGASLVDALLDPAGGIFGSFAVDPLPSVSLRDEGGSWTLRTDLPGVRAEDLTLEAEGRIMRVRATREGREIAFAVRLPSEIDASGAAAALEHGVLEIRVPRAAHARAISIPVSATALPAPEITRQIEA